MASGTITGSTNNEYIDAKVEWSSTTNNTDNTSSVKAALYYKRNNTGYQTYGTGSFSITINGKTTKATKQITITNSTWVKAVEATVTVSHSSDGSKSITISATGSITGTTFSSTSLSGTAKLDTIGRAATFSFITDYEVTLGETYGYSDGMNVTWAPLSKSHRYRLKYSLGDWTYTTDVIYPNQTYNYEYTISLPLEVASYIPKDETKATMTVELYTYSNSAGTTQVGEASSGTFTVNVPNNDSTKPTATMTLTPISSLDSPFDALYIKGRTKVDANFTNGKGKFGADIVSYKMSVAGKSYGSPYTSEYLPSSGNIEVTGTVTDSRGFSRKYTKTITVIPYEAPKILPASGANEIICARCDASGKLTDSGKYLKIKAKRSYSKVKANDVQKNFCSIRYRYRDESTNTFSSWKTILDKNSTTDTVDSSPISGVVSSTETAYVVQVGVVDDLGESAAVQFLIPTDFTTIDIPEVHKGKRIGFFRYVTETDEDGMYVGLPIFGGSVDSLKLGTRITATEASPIDLNDLKTPGCYYSPGGSYSEYILNSPYTEGGFGLEVREIQDTAYIRQHMYYGRNDWHRHWNGSEWSAWLRTLITTKESGAAIDYVIESGTYATAYGTWHYKKWEDGTYQMFGYFNVTASESAQRSGGVVYRTNSIGIPSPFKISSACISGTVLGHYWLSNGGISEDHKSIAIRLLSDKTISTTEPLEVRLSVMGEYE